MRTPGQCENYKTNQTRHRPTLPPTCLLAKPTDKLAVQLTNQPTHSQHFSVDPKRDV